MRTAQEMANFSEDFGFNHIQDTKWKYRLFQVVERELWPGEDVKFCFIGAHQYVSLKQHDGNYGYAITDSRLIMGQYRLSGSVAQAVALPAVIHLAKGETILMGILSFLMNGEPVSVAVAKEFVDPIYQGLSQYLTVKI